MSKENIILRTVTLVEDSSSDEGEHLGQGGERGKQTLADFRKKSAIVLLGEPGMGKTTEFKEASGGHFIIARDFVTPGGNDYQEKVLFIDGLDEMRAGAPDARVPFDAIRAKLQEMDKPHFRLSCREADWLLTDKAALEKVSSNGKVTVLRLDPLTDTDIKEYLEQQNELSISPSEFMEKARINGVDSLMRNPQLLRNLIDAVKENWPRSKTEVLKRAVDQMVQEHNLEHADGKAASSPPIPDRVQAARFLCSLMLLADKPHFSFSEVVNDKDTFSLSSLIYDNHDALLEVARSSKLFRLHEHRKFTYSHRSIAEYLCASYLCGRLDDGLPLGRALALLTGEDGVPVSSLRGVFAWLAALSGQHRRKLVQWDPLGVVLYGDVSQFTSGEIQMLLEHLKESFVESDREFIETRDRGRAFASLCVPGATEHLLAVLRSPDRSLPHQALALCVLDAMRYANDIDNANAKQLIDILRDSTWYPFCRGSALDVLISQLLTASPELLLGILDDIEVGKIDGAQGEFADMLLDALYPDVILAQDIFDYMHPLKDPGLIDAPQSFWKWKLIRSTDETDASVLLNELAARESSLFGREKTDHIFQMLADLIVMYLEFEGESLDVSCLVSWLSLGSRSSGTPEIYMPGEGAEQIQAWFSDHPEVQKKIHRHCIKQYLEEDRPVEDLASALYRAEALTRGSASPSDLQIWYLDEVLFTLEQTAARALFRHIYRFHISEAEVSEKIQKLAGKKPIIREWIAELGEAQQQSDERELRDRLEHERELEVIRKRNDAPRLELVAKIIEYLDAVESGTAPTKIFYHLATAYLGRNLHVREGDTPQERLYDLLKDEHLVEVALTGLKNCITRSDIPSYSSVLERKVKGKVHHLSYALAAGIEELTRKNPGAVDDISAEALKSAVAARLCILIAEPYDWHDRLLSETPDLVAEVTIDYFRLMLTSGGSCLHQANLLTHDTKYQSVVTLVAIPVLERFPVKSTKKQLATLAELLQAAREHNSDKLPPLVEKKLKYKSLTVGQKVHWLAMGTLIASEQYLNQLESYISRKPGRAEYLASAVYRWSSNNHLLDTLNENALHILMRIIVRGDKRAKQPGRARFRDGLEAEDSVKRLIASLASKTSDAASDAFQQMLDDDSLQEWHLLLSRTSHEQLTRVRESRFEYRDIKGVTATLAGGKPSCAADVAAVTYETILELGKDIKDGNTNKVERYWVDRYEERKKEFVRPRWENDCRDIFRDDLGPRLEKFDLVVDTEYTKARRKRSDIEVRLGSDINIPIEIKGSYSSKLWSGIHDQLIQEYTCDPKAYGYGIYLVFWFGPAGVKLPASGVRPKTPEKLCEQLRDSLKDSRERRLIQIAVIDCTSSKLTTSTAS